MHNRPRVSKGKTPYWPNFLILSALLFSFYIVQGQNLGYPTRSADIDVLPGFQNPPPGYGEVPFWWWSGDPLDKDRLLWQIEELHKKGITGMQVNYMHKDTPGWPTYPAEPEIFSNEWLDIWKFAAEECGKRNMGIGLSGYTLDWPKGDNLFNHLIYTDPEIQGREIVNDTILRVTAESIVSINISKDVIGAWAYPVKDSVLQYGGLDLASFVDNKTLSWIPRKGEWEIWVFSAKREPGTLNPIHPLAGKVVIDKFFQPFQDNAINQSDEGLNYFFQDEVHFGVEDVIWADDFNEEFKKRKGYDVFETLPALFTEMGTITPKARLDFLDVKVSLSEERYFIPIFNWHHSRGKIYGCDPNGRGLNPGAYGDNFRIQRWYTAPGHDTPGGNADLIKGKVSSSIANLYKRPRVWLEGYHSLGWGAAPERLMYATNENYLYGCNLLNLHGLYYTTHGSFWEWAPPCYHFRMPYWDHMPVFLKYFERLSYLLSQGVLQTDIAIMYPVSPVQARMDGSMSTGTAFTAGRKLFGNGYDFIFMDDQSLERSKLDAGSFSVSDIQFKVLVLPSMKAIRWPTLQKALAFYRSGGIVINVGFLPEASDHAGSRDPELNEIVRELFGVCASDSMINTKPVPQTNEAGGLGVAVNTIDELYEEIERLIPLSVESDPQARAMHRKIGKRDVYMIMDAKKDSWCTFKNKGLASRWDPWTGQTFSLETIETENGTRVKMPLDSLQAQIIVFRDSIGLTPSLPDQVRDRLSPVTRHPSPVIPLILDGEWEFELKPTMDNRWGDFRLPVTEQIIGAEARIFNYAEEDGSSDGWEQPGFNDSAWSRVTYGFGQKFWKLGPLPTDTETIERRFSGKKIIDPAKPVEIHGNLYSWEPYDFSWRWGKEGDPGHQGYHGLKEEVTDEFICLGKPSGGLNEILYKEEENGTCYYLWTNAYSDQVSEVYADTGGLTPAKVFINGKTAPDLKTGITLKSGQNPLLLRYDTPGRGHFVLLKKGSKALSVKTPLSMKWQDQSGRIPFDIRGTESHPAGWYRFIAPPGLKNMSIRANGSIQVWVDGISQEVNLLKGGTPSQYQVILDKSIKPKSTVAIRIEQKRGYYGGSALPEPILLECQTGIAETGDWSEGSVLENYSGGALYRKNINLTQDQARSEALLDLGEIVATAEVHINGKKAGILVAPPWKLDISEYIHSGENSIEILVYNTLSNHYLTIPSRYKGNSLKSGLIGPVKIIISESE